MAPAASSRLSIVIGGIVLATTALASAGAERLDRAIHAALGSPEDFLTAGEARYVNDKCGDHPADGRLHDLSIEDDELICPNGRRVRDPVIRALAERVSRRATARADAALHDPGVRAAMRGVEAEAVAQASGGMR